MRQLKFAAGSTLSISKGLWDIAPALGLIKIDKLPRGLVGGAGGGEDEDSAVMDFDAEKAGDDEAEGTLPAAAAAAGACFLAAATVGRKERHLDSCGPAMPGGGAREDAGAAAGLLPSSTVRLRARRE